MVSLSRGVLALGLIGLPLAARAEDSTPPSPPAPAARVAVPNVFAYDAPPGWSSVRLPTAPYPAAVAGGDAAGQGGVRAMITVNTDAAPVPLTAWCMKSLARNQAQFAELHAQVGELQRFATTAGIIGYCAPVDLTARGRNIHYVMYFFAGGGDTKIAVTCACDAASAAQYAPVFEGAMKTFVPY